MLDCMYVWKVLGDRGLVMDQRPQQRQGLEIQQALERQKHLGWERRGKLEYRKSPGPGLREEGPLGKFICMLPSGDVFCFVFEDSDSQLLLTSLPDTSKGPCPPNLCHCPDPCDSPETSRLTPAPRFYGCFGQHHLEEAQKSAGNNNCLGPGFHVLIKLFGRN